MFRILHNIWMNELRAQKVRTGGGLVAVEDIEISDSMADTETNIFAAEVLSEVNRLPEAQRACVILAYVEGFSYKDVARVLDIPIGTVMSRLASARGKLAKLNETSEAAEK